MTCALTAEVEVEIVLAGADDAGVPLVHVAGYAGLPDFWLYPGEREILSVFPGNACDGCHLPARTPAGWPPLETLVREALQ